MIIRSLLAGAFMAGVVIASDARETAAQVLLCPMPPTSTSDQADSPREAERLLQRLSIALDLHGHRGIDEAAIMQAHAATPGALLAKLGNVAERCARAVGDDPETFRSQLPELRKAFLEAVQTEPSAMPTTATADAEQADDEATIKPAAIGTDAARVERSIDLSVRELWRKLWFRTAKKDVKDDNRWAVIVASPPDADSGWDALGRHQRQWKDVYFQLHQPYFDDNPHHAIVVGRRLPREEAERLLAYVKELGMAVDSYVWPLPLDGEPPAVAETVATKAASAAKAEADTDAVSGGAAGPALDLSVLETPDLD